MSVVFGETLGEEWKVSFWFRFDTAVSSVVKMIIGLGHYGLLGIIFMQSLQENYAYPFIGYYGYSRNKALFEINTSL